MIAVSTDLITYASVGSSLRVRLHQRPVCGVGEAGILC